MHRYISVDAWTTIHFQLIKVFYLSRVNFSSFPDIVKRDRSDISFPEWCKEDRSGTLFSHNENLLMFWMEQVYMAENEPQELRLTGFNKDLSNGLVYKTILENYLGGLAPVSRELQQFRTAFNSEQDYLGNITKIINALKKVKLLSSFQSSKEFIQAFNQREMILFAAQLFFQLPSYTSQYKLVFDCLLE